MSSFPDSSDPSFDDRPAPVADRAPGRRTRSRLRRDIRGALYRAFLPRTPSGDEPLPDLGSLRRILLVSLNVRLGNTVLATVPLSALVDALPQAEFDLLGGPSAPAIVAGYGMRRVQVLERRDRISPTRVWSVVRGLRRERYEAAIHLNLSPDSQGAMLVGLSGARHRIGCRGEPNLFFTTAVDPPRSKHRIDRLLEYAAELGIEATGERRVILEPHELRWATRYLADQLGAGHAPTVAIFLAGRARKGRSWDLENFAIVVEGLRKRSLQPLVLLGPEEKDHAVEIRERLGEALYVEEPDLRRVAALVACCRAALSPDSGPMHLAIAAGTRTVGVFRFDDWQKRGPRPPHGEAVFDPRGDGGPAALEALLRCCDEARACPNDASI